ncbi:conserved protein, unknown function [Hepatocystis sp. ex Piliocolobus tephrosceles]|nr:conserved protein, unknown function [Hepatocystis sp. ex Piliocolobus tephrosceles]
MILKNVKKIFILGESINTNTFGINSLFGIQARCMKNKRRGLKEQARKKPLDIEKKIRNPYNYEKKMHFDNLTKGELYVPESCKGKKLAMLCNRLYYFNINDDELLDRYAQRAIVIANTMGTKEMSLILNTMRKFNYKNIKLLETFSKYIPSKLHKSVPQDISLILNAYAHFYYVDKNLFTRICEEIPHKIPYFQASHISSVINAFYRLKIKDQIIINDLVDEIIDRVEEFDNKSLTNTINSLVNLNYNNMNKQIIWNKLIEAVKQLHDQLSLLELTLITNAFCKKKLKNKNVYICLNDILCDRIFVRGALSVGDGVSAIGDNSNKNGNEHSSSISSSSCSNENSKSDNAYLLCIIFNAFAKIKFYSKDLVDFIVAYFSKEENYHSLNTQHYSQLIYSFSTFKLQNDNFINIFLKMASERIKKQKDINEQTLSTIAYSLAKLKTRQTDFLIFLSSYIINNKIILSPQSLCLICYSYSKLKIKSEIFFYILSIQLFENMNKFTKQGLSILLSSYANLKIFNVKLFSLINKYLNLYSDTFTNMECFLICKHFEYAIKCIDEEINNKNSDIPDVTTAFVTTTITAPTVSNDRSKTLVAEINNTKEDMKKFVCLLKNKISNFDNVNNSIKQSKVNSSVDNTEIVTKDNGYSQPDEEGGDDEREEQDDSFFSIFDQNDILNDDETGDEPGDETGDETGNKNEEKYSDRQMYDTYVPVHSNSNNNDIINKRDNHSVNPHNEQTNTSENIDKHSLKEKKDTLKIYESMFLVDTKKKNNIPGIKHDSLINEKFCSILNKEHEKMERENYVSQTGHMSNGQIEKENNDHIKKKSLFKLMTSNKPLETNYDKTNLAKIKSAEQIETEFIKAYVSEQTKVSEQNEPTGRKLKRRKKKISQILSKKYELIDDITALKKKWDKFYKHRVV